MCDYEMAMRKAISSVWPVARLSGCWFHYCQALRRKKASLSKLNAFISKNIVAEITFKLFLKLPLLPAEKLQAGFDQIVGFQEENGILEYFKYFNSYFERIWIKRFGYKTFTVHENTHRTNNFVESLNATLKRKLTRHPGIYYFLRKYYNADISISTLPCQKKNLRHASPLLPIFLQNFVLKSSLSFIFLIEHFVMYLVRYFRKHNIA